MHFAAIVGAFLEPNEINFQTKITLPLNTNNTVHKTLVYIWDTVVCKCTSFILPNLHNKLSVQENSVLV